MTADADLRDRTSQRAFELSQVAKDIAEGTNYEHFEMLYYDFDIEGESKLIKIAYSMPRNLTALILHIPC